MALCINHHQPAKRSQAGARDSFFFLFFFIKLKWLEGTIASSSGAQDAQHVWTGQVGELPFIFCLLQVIGELLWDENPCFVVRPRWLSAFIHDSHSFMPPPPPPAVLANRHTYLASSLPPQTDSHGAERRRWRGERPPCGVTAHRKGEAAAVLSPRCSAALSPGGVSSTPGEWERGERRRRGR